MFDNLLEKQLRLKTVIAKEDWAKIKEGIHYQFEKDSHFSELKESELLQNRATFLEIWMNMLESIIHISLLEIRF